MNHPIIDPIVKVDGRRERSAQSRRRILAGMIALLDRGVREPTAEQIAVEARVSLRSVFRHFEDMETLQVEIGEEISKRLGPVINKPWTVTAWGDVLDETIERRADLFEQVAPYKWAMELHKHRSHAVAAQLRRLNTLQRELLAARAPAEVKADDARFEALHCALSIETWQRLREQQALSVEQAKSAVRLMARGLSA